MKSKKTKARVSGTLDPIIRFISFDILCANCHRNGENNREYGMMCPPKEQCIATRGPKTEEDCPIWRTLNAPNAGSEGLT